MINCEYCGKETTKKRFCSRECMYAAKRKPRNKCPNCGKDAPRAEMKYCSMKCRDEYNKKVYEESRIYNKCIVCGKETPNEKYCSMKCMGEDRKTMSYVIDNLKNKNSWTEEKLDYLKENYGYLPIEELADYFNVSTSALIATASRYNIISARRWSDEEIEIVESNINDINYLLNNLNKSPSAIANQIRRVAMKNSGYDPSISPEELCSDILKDLGLDFEREVNVSKYRLDFLIDDLDIEVQGGYYHCDPRFYFDGATNETQSYMIDKDKERKEFLETKGYRVLYVWEHDLYVNREYVKELIMDNLVGVAELKSRN